MELPSIPVSKRAERVVLGAFLGEIDAPGWPLALRNLATRLEPRHFHGPKRRRIFEECCKRFEAEKPCDAGDIAEKLAGKDPTIFLELSECLDASVAFVPCDTAYWLETLQETGARRGIIDAARTLIVGVDQAEDVGKLAATAQAAADEVAGIGAGANYVDAKTVVTELFDDMQELNERRQRGEFKGGTVYGVPSGFLDVDAVTGGWHPGQMIVLAGRPGMGKSAIVSQFVVRAAKAGFGSLTVSLEMDRMELMQRLIASESGVPLDEIRWCNFPETAWQYITGAVGDMCNLPIYFADRGDLSWPSMRNICQEAVEERGVKLLVLDSLQIMNPGQKIDGRVNQVGFLTAAVKAMAKELRVPVILLSQLSRAVEKRDDKRPMLSDLRDSGTIEQDADIVGFLYRDDYYDKSTAQQGVAELNFAKHRQGETKSIDLGFSPKRMKFWDLVKPKDDDPNDTGPEHWND